MIRIMKGEKMGTFDVKNYPAISAGEKLEAGISYDDALALLKKYNDDDFHIEHGETVSALMKYFAGKNDAENADFWSIVGLLHDLDWEKWPDEVSHTTKTAELLDEAGVSKKAAHAIMTHNSDYNDTLPKPEHIMEKYLWATDELSGLYGAIIRMYPSHSAQDLNLKSVKKKFKNKSFAGGCDRVYMEKGAELLGISVEEMLEMYIEAYKELFD